MNVEEVSGSNLEILGKIALRVNPGKKVCNFRADFYVTPNFALPAGAILGLNSMKELQMEIKPGTNVVVYQGKQLVGMETPSPLASQMSNTDQHETADETHSVSPTEKSAVENKSGWPTVAAKVEGTGNPRQSNKEHYS